MALKTAQQIVDKWVRNMGNSVPDYVNGVEAVTEAPGLKAAASADKWLAGIQEAHRTRRFQEGVGAISLSSWKRNTAEKGAQRLASGAEAARSKMLATTTKLMVNVAEVKGIIDTMPDNTFEQRLARSQRWAQEMHARPIKGQRS